MSGKLYVVGTPIGNLSDFSPRAQQTLSQVDFIAAEDTRVTLKLLNRFEIKKPMVSYHEHNKQVSGKGIIDRLLAGETAALVTDAGMPAISDPGEDLVRLCHENGIAVESVPGPSALITALAISGMPSGRFCFEGFLTTNKTGRREHLQQVASWPCTLIFYEAPHKLLSTLKSMYEVFGNRQIALVRELTKIHEQVMRTTLQEAVAHFEQTPPKGEFVLIVAPPEQPVQEAKPFEEAVELARRLQKQGIGALAAAKEAAAATGYKKSEIYKAISE